MGAALALLHPSPEQKRCRGARGTRQVVKTGTPSLLRGILGSVLEETELILMKHDLSAVPKLYKLRVPGCCTGDIF